MLRSVYAFSSPSDTAYGKLVLRADGTIYGYDHPNERYWSIDRGELLLLNEQRSVTSRFRYCKELNVWQGHGEHRKSPFCLSPILALEDRQGTIHDRGQKSFLVNSIPKAGTYFAEAALAELGVCPTRLHLLGADIVDDYRGMSNARMHVTPEAVRINCPLRLVAALLNGELAVGHIEHKEVIENVRELGVCVLSLVRDLRDVIASLLRFKLNRVSAVGMMDEFWRELPEREQVLCFLMYFHERDLSHIRDIAEMMLADDRGITLRYEQMCRGEIDSKAAARLDAFEPGLARRLNSALLKHADQAGPTYSGSRSHWETIWNDKVEEYFQKSGMAYLNRALGYR